MKIFVASLATETNTFSPIYTGIEDFHAAFYAAPGKHPATPMLCSGPFIALRERASQEGWTLIEGTATWAEPAGIVAKDTYESLRDEILAQLRAAGNVDAAVFGLHGAMVAHGYDDTEGDLLTRAREIVGPDTVIAVSYDPHSHYSAAQHAAADFCVVFKEFPHTDFLERARDLVDILARKLRGEINPLLAVFDCRMIDIYPTSQQPMRSYVDKLYQIEQDDPKILSISVIHGFVAADVKDLGTRIIVVADDDQDYAQQLAQSLGMELFALRGQTRMDVLPASVAVQQAVANTGDKPAVIADIWDNPGGGVAGDATLLLRELFAQHVERVAISTIWDPIAVNLCFVLGVGNTAQLRFGAKSGPETGEPFDALVTVEHLSEDGIQQFEQSVVHMGKMATIRVHANANTSERSDYDVIVLLNTVRSQTFSPTMFTHMGVDPTRMNILVVKSSNHFYAAFQPIARTILYANGKPYPHDPLQNNFTKLERPIWPITLDPHQSTLAD